MDEETLEGGLAVDEGGDDVVRASLAGSEEHDVVFDDVGADHGITAHAEGEELGVGADAERGGVDGDVGVGLLFGGDGETGGDHAEEGMRTSAVPGWWAGWRRPAGLAGEALEGALLGEGVDVALDAERAGEAEMLLNLAEGRRDTLLALVGLDEIEDLLLTGGEGFGHDVCS